MEGGPLAANVCCQPLLPLSRQINGVVLGGVVTPC